MGSAQPRQTAEIAGWLESVQRDPRTLGAFRRRIESLLTDPAVARRIAGRLERRSGDGAQDGAQGDRRPARGCLAAAAPATAGTIFGSCNCDGPCRLMVPDLRWLAGRAVPPQLHVSPLRH